MNCKPGQLAYIVDDCPYTGKVVEVIEMQGWVHGYDNCWWVKAANWKMKTTNGMASTFLYPDCYLRPISGVSVHDKEEREVSA